MAQNEFAIIQQYFADVGKPGFDPIADLLLRADLLLVVIAVLASAAAVVPRLAHGPGRLEPPMLLRGRS